MSDKQFDPLDHRFRQAAEQFDPPHNPEDWVAMEKLLDKKKDRKRPFFFWWITDAFMVCMLLIFIYQMDKAKDNISTEQIISTSPTAKQEGPVAINQHKNELKETSVSGAEDNSKEERFDKIENSKAVSSNKIKLNKEQNRFEPRSGGHSAGYASKKTNSNSKQKTSTPSFADPDKPGPDIHENQSSKSIGVLEGSTAIAIGAPKPVDSSLMEREKNEMNISTEELNPNMINDSALQDNPIVPNEVEVEEMVSAPKKKKDFPPHSKEGLFSITATYGFEKSGVKNSPLGPTGAIYGALAGYQWSKKWGVKLGIFMTDKNYNGGSGVYKLPYGSPYQDITNFKAICDILEIPLLVSYQFKQGKRSNWMLSAGPVTSIMKSEEYHYNYINSAGVTGYGRRYYTSNEVDWFSGFRISPSYERLLGKRFSVSADPFIHLPIMGVGKGSVNLLSMGFQLGTTMYLGSIKNK